MKSLQDIITCEYTANMNQNLISIISKDQPMSDNYYYLPWLLPDQSDLSNPRLQLMFRIRGNRQNIWELEAYDGDNTILFVGNNDLEGVINYNISHTGIILKSGHKVNYQILESVFKCCK